MRYSSLLLRAAFLLLCFLSVLAQAQDVYEADEISENVGTGHLLVFSSEGLPEGAVGLPEGNNYSISEVTEPASLSGRLNFLPFAIDPSQGTITVVRMEPLGIYPDFEALPLESGGMGSPSHAELNASRKYIFTVAFDLPDDGGASTFSVAVPVTNVLVFSAGSYTVRISENEDITTVNKERFPLGFSPVIALSDALASTSYQIADVAGLPFEAETDSTGQVQLFGVRELDAEGRFLDGPDYEALDETLDDLGNPVRSYVFVLEAVDGVESATAEITVNITNDNEMSKTEYSASLAETAADNAAVSLDFPIAYTGLQGYVEYGITAILAPESLRTTVLEEVEERLPFTINETTGIISLRDPAAIDYEALDPALRGFRFRVVANRTDINSDGADVVVNVSNVNELSVGTQASPSYSATIDEDVVAGVLPLGDGVPNVAYDGPNPRYRIDEIFLPESLTLADLPFSVDLRTGILSVIRTETLFPDYEKLEGGTTYEFQISASEFDFARVVVKVNNCNELSAAVKVDNCIEQSAAIYQARIGEDVEARPLSLDPEIAYSGEDPMFNITEVLAPDAIASTNETDIAESLPFSINPQTGVISVVRQGDLFPDFDSINTDPSATAAEYRFVISAGLGDFDRATVIILVESVNEPPELVADKFTAVVNEDESGVLRLSPEWMPAADPDGDAVSYTLIFRDGAVAVPFVIDQDTGVITILRNDYLFLDYEALPEQPGGRRFYEFQIVATARGGSDFAEVRVEVRNLFDDTPEFSQVEYDLVVLRGARGQTPVGSPIVAQPAENRPGTLSYALTTPDSAPFELAADFSNGAQIVTAGDAATEVTFSASTYELTLTANFTPEPEQQEEEEEDDSPTDTDPLPVLSSSVSVRISVSDESATIRLGDLTVTEDSGEALIPVLVSGRITAPLELSAEIGSSSTATQGEDYLSEDLRVQIAAGSYDGMAASLAVTLLNDVYGAEGTETLELLLVPPESRPALSFPGNGGTLRIVDDDSLQLTIEDVSTPERAEGQTEASRVVEVTATLTGRINTDLTVLASATAITATAGVDYISFDGLSVNFSAQEDTNVHEAAVEIRILDDDLLEQPESLRVTLEPPAGISLEALGVTLGSGGGLVTIIDDEQLATVGQRVEELITMQAVAAKAYASLTLNALQARFALSLGQASGFSQQTAGSGAGTEVGAGLSEQGRISPRRGLSAWVHGGVYGLNGEREFDTRRLEYDGQASGVTVGLEQQWNPNFITGLSVSLLESDLDYQLVELRDPVRARLTDEMSFFALYGAMRPVPNFLVWLTAGGGTGDLQDRRENVLSEFVEQAEVGSEFFMAAMGGDYRFSSRDSGIALDLIGAVYAVRKQTDDEMLYRSPGAGDQELAEIPRLTVDLYEARAGLRLELPLALGSSARLRPHLRLDLVLNEGDYPFDDELALDIEAGLALDWGRLRFSVDGSLEVMREDQVFWGIEGEAKWLVLAGGRGLSLEVTTQAGGSSSLSDAFVGTGQGASAHPMQPGQMGIGFEAAYSFSLPATEHGIWGPYFQSIKGISSASPVSYRGGLRASNGHWQAELETGLHPLRGGSEDSGLLLRFSGKF